MARRWNLPGQFAELIENHVAVEAWAAKSSSKRPRPAQWQPRRRPVGPAARRPAIRSGPNVPPLRTSYQKVRRRDSPR